MSDTIPPSPDHYQPIVAELDGVPKGVTIATDHPQYKAATQAAFAAGLSQNQFSRLLAHETQRVVAASKAASAAPKPAAPAPKPAAAPANSRHVTPATELPRREPPPRPYNQMTMAEKLNRFGHL